LQHDADIRRLVERACVDNERDLRAFLNGVLHNSQLTEDAFQQTVVKAIESSSAVDSTKIRGWLFRIALNVARDAKRNVGREERSQRAVHELTLARTTDNIHDAVAHLITKEEQHLLQQALNRLKPDHREVVIRRIQQDQTFVEIAEELNRPLGTILTWMRRALSELREMNIVRSLSDDETSE
jgi:RNA polymerase sigma factor (sigma-70 family)